MLRLSLLVLIACLPVAAVAQDTSINQAKLNRWKNMSAEEKAELRRRLKKFKSLPKEEQERLRQNLRKLKELPVEKQKKVRRQIQRLTPEELGARLADSAAPGGTA